MNGNNIALDTNIILYLLAGDQTLSEFLQDKQGFISIITEMELIGFSDITTKELKQIKKFLNDCTIIDINDEIKEIYATIRKKYRSKLADAIVAASAIYLDIPLMSADKGFTKVSELQLTSYNP